MKTYLKKLFNSGQWQSEGQVSRRVYKSYEEYVEHQKAKLAKVGNPERKIARLRQGLGERLAAMPEIKHGTNALCLAARFGGEVGAFIDRGVFAIGIDLNPGPDNKYVVVGDFHDLQFSDASIDCVFTNSLDHVFDFDRVMTEVQRVLKPTGHFIAEIAFGDDAVAGEYESFWYESADTLISKIEGTGFDLLRKADYAVPLIGVSALFRSRKAK